MSLNRVDGQLQHTLENWQCWDVFLTKKPVVVEELLGGKTNRSFLVETTSGQVVVRINAENSRSLGIDRQREAEILLRLQTMGCVPKTLFISEQVLVSEYISGRCWEAGDLENKDNLKKVSNLLSRIQEISLPEKITRRNYVEYCQNYIQQLPVAAQQSEKAFIEKLNCAAIAIDQAGWKPVINHHDLVPENIIEAEPGVFLLDWEYVAYGHPAIDFVRLYGAQHPSPLIKELLILQQGIDKLWGLVSYGLN